MGEEPPEGRDPTRAPAVQRMSPRGWGRENKSTRERRRKRRRRVEARVQEKLRQLEERLIRSVGKMRKPQKQRTPSSKRRMKRQSDASSDSDAVRGGGGDGSSGGHRRLDGHGRVYRSAERSPCGRSRTASTSTSSGAEKRREEEREKEREKERRPGHKGGASRKYRWVRARVLARGCETSFGTRERVQDARFGRRGRDDGIGRRAPSLALLRHRRPLRTPFASSSRRREHFRR